MLDAQSVIAMNAAFPKAYLAIALSSLAQGQAQTAVDNYQKMAAASPAGASLASMGLADCGMISGTAIGGGGSIFKN